MPDSNPTVPPSPIAIEVSNLRVRVGNRSLLDDASFSLRAQKLAVLLGASGSGKSTLMRILAGLEGPEGDSDRVWWSGDIRWHSRSHQHRLGLVFQQPALLDELSPLDNVQLAIDHRLPKSARSVSEETPPAARSVSEESPTATRRVSEGSHPTSRSVDEVESSTTRNGDDSKIDDRSATGLTDHRSSRKKLAHRWLDDLLIPWNVQVSRLSGGQRQRLSLAQSLASEPELIIFDEPTTGLDALSALRVAQLIRRLQDEAHVTSIVVTHDYESFLSFADDVFVLDTNDGKVKPVKPPTREAIHASLESQVFHSKSSGESVVTANKRAWRFQFHWLIGILASVGAIVEATAISIANLIPWRGRVRWYARFFLHFARLVSGLTAVVYLAVSGAIIGFVTTYFTLKFMPYKIYTQPLLIEELVGAVGFALYRILIPVLTTILIAARCAAAVSADLGNKRYGGQYESLKMIGVPVANYWLFGTLWSFLLGSLLLNQVAFYSAKWTSAFVFCDMYPELGVIFWQTYFHRTIEKFAHWYYDGVGFVVCRLLFSAFGTAAIAYHLSLRPKWEGPDVSRSITTTILWSTLWVLAVHLIISLVEFR